MYFLYKITNRINGKIYIGQTNNIRYRWNRHRYESKHPKYAIHLAMQKYGIDNFKIDIIAICESLADANLTEIFLIKYNNTQNKKIGYNIEVGGNRSPMSVETKQKISQSLIGHARPDISIANTNRIVSEETKQKISIANIGKIHTEETKQKISKSHTGIKTGPLSIEHKQKLSKAGKGKKRSDIARKNISNAKLGDKNPATRYRGKNWKIIDGKRVWYDKD